jgi:hypothetical protein
MRAKSAERIINMGRIAMNGDHQIARLRWGSAKPVLIIAIIVLVAVIVPLGLYIVAEISFPNGSTGADLSVPDTGNLKPPAAARNGAAANNTVTGKAMDLLVVDQATKEPIPGLTVQNGGLRTRYRGTTGADGNARVPSPADQSNNFTIRVSGKGYVPKRLEWASYRPELQGEVPATYTLEMEHTTTVRGKIVDDDGQPVAGATVILDFTNKYSNPHEQIDLGPYSRNGQIKSGDDGSFSFKGAPVKCDQIGLTAWDYKHVSADFWTPQPFNPVSKLYDGTATFTLHKGVELEGVVLDPQGSPLAGATVGRGQYRNSSNAIPALTTDSSGKFTYVFEPGSDVVLTAEARGCAPEMTELTMGSQKQSITIRMSKPHRITGKVVNGAGKPVPNASLYLQNWRGKNTINANFTTDAGGNFHWNQAPADPVTFSVSARNLRGVDDQVLYPDKDNLVTLGPVVHIRGSVTDAQTGKPIDKIHLIFGIVFNEGQQVNWQPGWNSDLGVKPGGKFDFTNDYSYPAIAVRIEAPGYLPVESKVLKPEDGDATLDLKMRPGKDIVATVHAPDGSVVSGAMVVLALPGQNQAFIMNSRQLQNMGASQRTTGADGRIDFPPQAGIFKIAVFADAGYAEADQDSLAKSADITLAPWGRIEGQLMVGSKPAAGQTVDVLEQNMMGYDPQKPIIRDQLSAPTDADGKFVLDRVPPGTWNITRRIPFRSNGWSYSPLQSGVEVSAGKTVTVNVGGTGRPVVGRVIILPELASRLDWAYSSCNISTRSDSSFPAVPMPDDIRNATPEKQQAWGREWIKTDAGKAFVQKMQKSQMNRRSYPFTVNADGSFRVEDVLAGDYELNIDLRKNENRNGMPFERVGVGAVEFTVPEMPGGRSDEPLQIDPVTIVKLAKYVVGDEVYDLAMTSNGKNLKVSDFRGKYLLLDIRPPMKYSVAPVKAVYDDYGHDDRLAMLTVWIYFGPMGRPTTSPDAPWQQAAVVPTGPDSAILGTNFGIDDSFSYSRSSGSVAPSRATFDWLIGPDGKVVAADLSGDAVKAAVTAALGPPATQPATAP